MKKLANEGKALVVALDDINHLFYSKNANQILYDILRAHEVFPGVRTGVFAIISDIEFRYMLDKNVSSVFIPQEIVFDPYTFQEIRDILHDRVKVGFYPSVLSDELLDEITEVTLSTGDLRVGIDLLRTSGNFAEADASRTIQKQHLQRAMQDFDSHHLQDTISKLSGDEKNLLRMIVKAEADITAGDLYELLKDETKPGEKDSHSRNSISYASFDRALKKTGIRKIN